MKRVTNPRTQINRRAVYTYKRQKACAMVCARRVPLRHGENETDISAGSAPRPEVTYGGNCFI